MAIGFIPPYSSFNRQSIINIIDTVLIKLDSDKTIISSTDPINNCSIVNKFIQNYLLAINKNFINDEHFYIDLGIIKILMSDDKLYIINFHTENDKIIYDNLIDTNNFIFLTNNKIKFINIRNILKSTNLISKSQLLLYLKTVLLIPQEYEIKDILLDNF